MAERCRHCGRNFAVQEVKLQEDPHGFTTRHCPYCLLDLDRWYCECGQVLDLDPIVVKDLGEKGAVEVRRCSFCGKPHFVLCPYSPVWPVSERSEDAFYCSFCRKYYRPVYYRHWDSRRFGYWRVWFCPACGQVLKLLSPRQAVAK